MALGCLLLYSQRTKAGSGNRMHALLMWSKPYNTVPMQAALARVWGIAHLCLYLCLFLVCVEFF